MICVGVGMCETGPLSASVCPGPPGGAEVDRDVAEDDLVHPLGQDVDDVPSEFVTSIAVLPLASVVVHDGC